MNVQGKGGRGKNNQNSEISLQIFLNFINDSIKLKIIIEFLISLKY